MNLVCLRNIEDEIFTCGVQRRHKVRVVNIRCVFKDVCACTRTCLLQVHVCVYLHDVASYVKQFYLNQTLNLKAMK